MFNILIDKYHKNIAKIDPRVPGANGMKPIPNKETKYLDKLFIILLILA